MPIYRSNRPARILSRQEKLDLFCNYTVVHPHLKKAYEEFRDAVNNPGGASVILRTRCRRSPPTFQPSVLFGPTGVGKTTLLRQIMKVMVSEKTAQLKRDPNYLPVATAEARAPESGSFDWKVYYQSVLASLAESPVSDCSIPNRSKLKKSKPYQRSISSKNSHLSTLREQVIVTTSAFPCVLRRRGVARQYAPSRFSSLFD